MAINTDGPTKEFRKSKAQPNTVPSGAGDAMAIALTGSLENQAAMIRGFVGAAELSVDAAAQDFADYLTRYGSGQRLIERTFEIMAEQPQQTINITAEVQAVDLGIPAPSLGDGLARFKGLFGGAPTHDIPAHYIVAAPEPDTDGEHDD